MNVMCAPRFVLHPKLFIFFTSHAFIAAASQPRLSETPKWFMFETSCYAFSGRIRHFTTVGHPIMLQVYADKRIVNVMNVYIERNNLQLELILYSKQY